MDHPITRFRDKYKGKRCFIIGNGPSLARTPLSLIKGEFSIGINRIGMHFSRTDWRPSHFICITDWVSKDSYRADVLKVIDLGIPCFMGERIRQHIKRDDQTIIWINALHIGFDVREPKHEWWERDISDGTLSFFGNSVFAATRLAVYMGLNPLYLVGCDLGWKGIDNDLKDSKQDPDHFDPNYEDPTFQKPAGYWDVMNPIMIRSHEIVRDCTEKIGVEVYNATLGGELEVYTRVNFLEVALKVRKSKPRPRFRKIRVEELFDKHQGERIFIVGCAKNLTVEQLDLIRGEYSFGLNRIAMMYGETDWRPNLFTVAPPEYLSYKPFRDDVIRSIELGIPSFLCERLRSHIENGVEYGFGDYYNNIHYISCTTNNLGAHLEWWATDYLRGGKLPRYSSSTFRAAMISIKMGFTKIIFIGVGMNYAIHKMGEPDPNHFAPDYVPSLGITEAHRELINESFLEQYERLDEQANFLGIKVINASVGGLLETFHRVDLRKLVNRRKNDKLVFRQGRTTTRLGTK